MGVFRQVSVQDGWYTYSSRAATPRRLADASRAYETSIHPEAAAAASVETRPRERIQMPGRFDGILPRDRKGTQYLGCMHAGGGSDN